MRLPSRTRSTAFQLTAAISGLNAVAVLIVFGLAYLAAEHELDDRMRASVEELRVTLLTVYESGGLEALTAQVATQAIGATAGESLYFLGDETRQWLAGNATFPKPLVGWRTLHADEVTLRGSADEGPDSYLLSGTLLKDGILIVGRSNEEVEEVKEVLLSALLLGMLASVALSIGGGVLLGRKAERRISVIRSTLAAVAKGDLKRRIPLSGRTGDDLDRVSEAMNRTLDRLRDLMASLRQVSADIAHDLKTPIQRLRQILDKAQTGANAPEDNANAIEQAIAETDTIIATFQALLRVAQIEGGAGRDRFTELDLTDLVQTMADAYGTVAEDAGHRFHHTVPDGRPVRARGDRELLNQLLANLIENAIHHCTPPTDIVLTLTRDTNEVVICVSDTGPGIPESEHERVFRRLYRLEKSRTTPGSGLGLSLVKAIVDLHEATIELSSNDPGLLVTIRLSAPTN